MQMSACALDYGAHDLHVFGPSNRHWMMTLIFADGLDLDERTGFGWRSNDVLFRVAV